MSVHVSGMDVSHPLRQELERLQQHYDSLARQHGDTPAAVQQSSIETQDRRLQVLAEIAPLGGAAVLDFGCGAGRLLHVLKESFGFDGSYTGYDLSDELLRIARAKHPAMRWERRDIFAEGVGGEYDYAFISGVFNNRITENDLFMRRTLETLFPHVRRGLAFNALSAYVDYKDPDLYYADPEEVFRFCKEHLSRTVTLRHDYEIKPGVLPYEFTVYVYRAPHAVRPKTC
jgi:SAM-dependent methyltransferase